MLRINKKTEILFRKKERFFSRELMKALLIAVSFHFLFFLFFKISWFIDTEELHFLAPVSVEIDISYEPPLASVPMTDKAIPLENIIFPTLLEMPPPNLVIERSAFKEKMDDEADFSELEILEYESLDFEEM